MVRPAGSFVVALVLFFAASAAFAGERGLVANSGGMLKAEPKPKGKKIDKLKQGSMVDVVDHSPDGLWVKVAVKGPDGAQEGWVEKSYVRSVSRYGFSWERKDKGGGTQLPAKSAATPTPKPVETPKELPADPVPEPADTGWGTETVEDPSAVPVEDPAADPAEGWDDAATPAADATATPEEAGWGEESTPAPAPGETPEEGDGWGTEAEVDLTQ